MKTHVPCASRTATFATFAMVTALAALVMPAPAASQSALDVSEAEAFLGDWVVPINTPQGSVDMALLIEDRGGKVAVRVGSTHGSEEVTDVRRTGDSLVLSYLLEEEGMTLPISMTLRPHGRNLSARLDVGGGMFVFDGMARPADS